MSDKNDVNELMETEGNIDQINRRAFVRCLARRGSVLLPAVSQESRVPNQTLMASESHSAVVREAT